jgi:hypothetical protein
MPMGGAPSVSQLRSEEQSCFTDQGVAAKRLDRELAPLDRATVTPVGDRARRSLPKA